MDALTQQVKNSASVSLSNRGEDYPTLHVQNGAASAEVALHGAHIMSFVPTGHDDLLWLSSEAIYTERKAIRGGIPICWPWFGDHPNNEKLPAHGFVRNRFWELESITEPSDSITQMVFVTEDDEHSRKLWPHAFKLRLSVTVTNTLTVDLEANNTDKENWSCGGALHTYFGVGDIQNTVIEAVAGQPYLNKPEGFAERLQKGPLSFTHEVDRVYCNFEDDIHIDDQANQRKIKVAKSGSKTTVIWNPWQEIAEQMKDMNDDGYKRFVCVEPANAFDDQITLSPGDSHHLTTSIGIVGIESKTG